MLVYYVQRMLSNGTWVYVDNVPHKRENYAIANAIRYSIDNPTWKMRLVSKFI